MSPEEIETLVNRPEIWECTIEDLAELARAYLYQMKLDSADPEEFEIVVELVEEAPAP